MEQRGHAGQSGFLPLSQNYEGQKTFTWPTAAIDNKTNCYKKWVIWLFLIRKLSLLLVFRMFDLTIHQDKKYPAFFSRKNITKFLHGEIVRYKCNLLTKSYFLTLSIFQNMSA